MDAYELIFGLAALASATTWVALWKSETYKPTILEMASMIVVWAFVAVITVWALWP